MTVKEIVELLPNKQPFRLEVDNLWTGILYKNDCFEYTDIMQEYGNYNVVVIEAFSGVYDDAIIWLKVERKEQ